MQHTILNDILILLSVAIVTVTLFRWLGLPAILGYLCVGLIAGPYGLGWLVFDDVILFLGELGIVFLLFSIGLEFSLPLLLGMRRYLLGIGSVQVAIGTLSGFIIAYAFGVDARGALIFGAAAALSSTAIVLTQLASQNELKERHGRIAIGVLLFQDLAAVPFLVIIPLLAAETGTLWQPLLLALTKSAVAFVLIWFIGRRLLPSFLHSITQAGSRELFTLAVLFLALATAWLTHMAGLSLAMGAFLAGMLLSETIYRHQIEADARPFRDILLGLFFVTVGMELDYQLLPDMWLETLILLLGITIGKGTLIIALVWFARIGIKTAFRTGIILGHGGEFGIALLFLALGEDLLSHSEAQPVLAAMIISMLIAPVLVRHNLALGKRLFKNQPKEPPPRACVGPISDSMQDHVVIAGFGRVGQNLAVILRKLNTDYIALDTDNNVIHQACLAGESVYYGDCTQPGVLAQVGLRKAKAMVVTVNDLSVVARSLSAAHTIDTDSEVLVCTRDDRNLETYLSKGACEVIPGTLEASLAVAEQLLRRLNYGETDIQPLLKSIRRDGYHELRGTYSVDEERRFDNHQIRLQTVCLTQKSYAVGRRIDDLGLDKIGASVVAIRRHGIRGEKPSTEARLCSDDAVVIEGTIRQLDFARQRLLKG